MKYLFVLLILLPMFTTAKPHYGTVVVTSN